MAYKLTVKTENEVWKLTICERIDETLVIPECPEGVKAITVDCSQSTYINSGGVRKWVQWIKRLDFPRRGLYIQVFGLPLSFIRVAESIPELLPPECLVRSFFLDYVCGKCGRQNRRLFEVQGNTPFPTEICPTCRCECELELPEAFYKRLIR